MRLTTEQIKSVTFGALSVEEQADGLHFHKCTQKQETAFAAFNSGFFERAKTTTGVRLDFHTTSKHLAFSATSGRKFEVYLNNLLRRQFDFDVLRAEGRCAELDLTDVLGDKVDDIRVTLVFPSHSIGVLEFVELDDGATLVPHTFDRKILFLGDSITQGWNSDYDGFSYAWRVSRFFNAESVVQGIGGAFFHETVFDTVDFDPDTVIVALGTNDFSKFKTTDEMRAHVSAYLSLVASEYADKKLFVISPIWRADQEKTMGSFLDAREVVIRETEKLGLRHIDGLSLVPPMEEFMKDGYLHPNDLGFSLYAENLIAQMIKN